MAWPFRKILLLALAAATLNIIPRLLAAPGTDVVFHYALINCFGEQFWQGDLYPRWCMSANAGLGAGLFLFYFPGSYYITALFYPLHWLGVRVQEMYLLSMWLAGAVGFITCWWWLKEIASPGRAALCALLFLFLPYRMELMLYRSAFAELWAISLVPLMFLSMRRFTRDDKKYWPMLAAATALCLVMHVPQTIGALMACGMQALLLTGRHWVPKLRFAGAVIMAGMATTFYTIPAKFFLQYISPASLKEIPTIWANGYIHWIDFTDRSSTHAHLPILINTSITVLLVAGLAFMAWRRRAQITDATLRKEMLAWAMISLLAVFMLFEPSKPLWDILSAVSIIAFPWRIQSLLMFAAIYFVAVKAQWLMSAKQMKTWKADYAAALLLFIMLGLSVLNSRPPEVAGLMDRVVTAHIVHVLDYRTRWANPDLDEPNHVLARFENPHPPAKASVINGRGSVTVDRWSCRGIQLTAHMQQAGAIRLQHFYFPLWHLTIDGRDSEALLPQKGSGLMQIDVPAGEHRLCIVRDMHRVMGVFYPLSLILSILALGILLAGMYKRNTA